MKNEITEQDMATLRDIAANQLSPLSKMEEFIRKNYDDISPKTAGEISQDILDQVAG